MGCCSSRRRRWIAAVVLSLLPLASRAAVLYDVTLPNAFTQSRTGSDAHLVEVRWSGASASCNGSRLYIAVEDEEL